jgi:hypothetical protein
MRVRFELEQVSAFVGIRKIRRAANEGGRAHRMPELINQIRAGFHYDD